MPIRETIFLAIEAVLANKLRSALTMLGLIIGVGAVVLLVSIGNGARNYITHEFEGLGTNLILVQPGRTDSKSGLGPPIRSAKQKLTLADVEALDQQATNLDAVTGIMFGTGTVKSQDNSISVNIFGSNDRFIRIFNMQVGQGSFFSREEEDTGRRVAVLGYNSAKQLFGDTNPLGRLVKINESEHRIEGVMKKSGESLGFDMDNLVFIPTRPALRIFNEDKLFGIRARAKSKASVQDAVEEIRAILKQRQNGEENFTIETQVSILETMNTILGMLTYVLGGIATISMIVGGIGIMNIMLVSVTERTREIGIRRAVGARRVDVLRQFLAEAVALSVTGGLIGLSGATLLTYIVYWALPKFDMRAPVWILLPAFLVSAVIGIVFGVWPAYQASKIETIDALRYE